MQSLFSNTTPMGFSTLQEPASTNTLKLSPWAHFDKLWTSVIGSSPDKFKFTPGVTPFSTLRETVAMIALYLVVIFGGREFMRNRPAYKLNGLFMLHNFCLTAISGALLVLFAEQLIPSLWKNGLYENICGADGWTPPLVILYYVGILGIWRLNLANASKVELPCQIC